MHPKHLRSDKPDSDTMAFPAAECSCAGLLQRSLRSGGRKRIPGRSPATIPAAMVIAIQNSSATGFNSTSASLGKSIGEWVRNNFSPTYASTIPSAPPIPLSTMFSINTLHNNRHFAAPSAPLRHREPKTRLGPVAHSPD